MNPLTTHLWLQYFMISKRRVESLGRFLTALLRHTPEAANLDMDKQGWVSVSQLVNNTQNNEKPTCLEEIIEVVQRDDKDRFGLKVENDDTYIRCKQGHNGRLGLELKFDTPAPPETLFHGYPSHIEAEILEKGLVAMDRSHVHLSKDIKTALSVAKRHGEPMYMVVHSGRMVRDGLSLYLSDNNVWLADSVPPEYLTRP